MTAFALIHDPLGDNEHEHAFPEDWIWGGSEGLDPRADPRYVPETYTYYDADTTILTLVQTHHCDDEALNYFSIVAEIKGSNPRWVSVKRRDGSTEMLPYTYNKATDELESST